MVNKRKKKRPVHKKKSTVKRKKTKSTKQRIAKAPPVTINMPAMQPQQQSPVNNIMIENFVSLQRVLTTLSAKMDTLTTQLTKLLDLFEISAKSLAEREFEIERDNKDTLEKLNVLLDQNKILARGLSLMHERMPLEQFPHPQNQQIIPQQVPQTSQYMKEFAPSPPPFQPPTLSFRTPPKKPAYQEAQETSSLGMPSIMSSQPKQEEESEDNFNSPKSNQESNTQEPTDFDSFIE